jgi:hypothetical protein
MNIRRTTIKSRQTGEPYYTYRLVESIHEGGRVRQRTLLNLGRHLEVPREQWDALVQRIEHLVGGQQDLMPAYLDARWEEAAQRYAAQLIRTRASVQEGRPDEGAGFPSAPRSGRRSSGFPCLLVRGRPRSADPCPFARAWGRWPMADGRGGRCGEWYRHLMYLL